MPKIIEKVDADQAPRAIGSYSQAVRVNAVAPYVFVSGQLPIDPATGELVEGEIRTLTKRVLDNIEEILKASGSSMHFVVRVDVFLTDLNRDFSGMNEEYSKRFNPASPPARQTVQVAALPKGAPIEISCIALAI